MGAVCIPIYLLNPHSGAGKEDFTDAQGAVGRLLRATTAILFLQVILLRVAGEVMLDRQCFKEITK